MSNQFRKIRRAMSLKQMKQVPVVMVPVFAPVHEQLDRIASMMNKEMKAVTRAGEDPPQLTNVVALINSTLAQAVNAWHQGRKIKEEKSGHVQLVGGDMLSKLKSDEKKRGKR